jgi:hypothetical protein
MPLNWIDTTDLSFNSLLLLERVQISWLPGWLPEPELAVALHANPVVAWYLGQKCPEVAPWLDKVLGRQIPPPTSAQVEAAERQELERVTQPGGMVILCPGNDDSDNAAHQELLDQGYHWSRFTEPGLHGGVKRKYWKKI